MGSKDDLAVLREMHQEKRPTRVVLLTAGMRNKEIADKLYISEGTVKIHLHHIYEKLRIDGRWALLRYARDKGLV